ncbi:hypothetical protein KAU09_00435 [Candidatus Parcubacteria bacterium]|nr:hypothetical protein [Candidatus Parcubacteria bacterium]
MMTNNFTLYGIKILAEIARDILFFPFWWYSRGLFNVVQKQIFFLKNMQKSLALLVWIKNIFKPMYGQRDWQGILISIFIRSVQIVFRSFLMLFLIIFSLFLIIFWIILPPLVIFEIFFQLL